MSSVLALYLPAGEDKACTLKDEVHFGAARGCAPETSCNIGEVNEAHKFECQGFKGKATDMTVLGIQFLADFLKRFSQ